MGLLPRCSTWLDLRGEDFCGFAFALGDQHTSETAHRMISLTCCSTTKMVSLGATQCSGKFYARIGACGVVPRVLRPTFRWPQPNSPAVRVSSYAGRTGRYSRQSPLAWLPALTNPDSRRQQICPLAELRRPSPTNPVALARQAGTATGMDGMYTRRTHVRGAPRTLDRPVLTQSAGHFRTAELPAHRPSRRLRSGSGGRGTGGRGRGTAWRWETSGHWGRETSWRRGHDIQSSDGRDRRCLGWR